MPWQDRLRELAYTAPSGARLASQYENVENSFDRRTTAFEFPDADGTFVQDLKRSGRRIPLRMIFSGDDYDQVAEQFDAMLSEQGVGRLEHPIYGTFNVVPSGKISRRDDLKTRGNQAVFEIEFLETNDLLFPSNSFSPAADVIEALDSARTTLPDNFDESVVTDTTIEQISLRDRFQSVIDQIESVLKPIADQESRIAQQFDTVFESINDGLTGVIADPLTLAFQAQILAQLPGRSVALIADRLAAYASLLAQLTTNGVIYSPGTDAQPLNAYEVDSLFASNLVLGAVVSVLDNEFELKPVAVAAAELILSYCDELTQWQDDNVRSLGIVDTGESYQQVSRACAVTAGFLVELSFSLKPERSIVTDRARTIVDLEAELYGTVDTNMDFLITSNDLSGDEILEVPKGRTVVYYR